MRPFRASTALAVLCAAAPVLAQAPAGVTKIRGDVYYHQRLKGPAPGKTLEQRRALARSRRLDAEDLDREEVVIYVREKLRDEEIAELRAQGVDVTPDVWVPPVGNHPLGFHLADVRYDRLDVLERDARVVRVESVEVRAEAQNDTAGALIHVDDVHAGIGVPAFNGAGVNLAVADSGLDLTHADVPTPVETFDMTDGSGPGSWSTNVANLVENHGTHVTGTAVGSGSLSGGQYVGGAPGANLYFYKIGNDTNGNASWTNMIEAINRAAAVGADVFSMSYGGFSSYMDGSSTTEQAIDAAVASGTAVFISAGNDGASAEHDSASVAPGTSSGAFGFTIDNTNGAGAAGAETIQVIWIDDQSGDQNLTLTCTNLGAGESLTQIWTGTSSRGTEAVQYSLTPNLPAGQQKSYSLVLTNAAGSGSTPLVHCYAWDDGSFDDPDNGYTVTAPALADGAIAVAAWVHRSTWTDYQGSGWTFSETEGGRATFSSIGPRIDGRRKPEIAAPGSAMISLLDSGTLLEPVSDSRIIDNDGLNLDGSGPANYAVFQGTSMACPMAAGVAALLLESNGSLTPADLLGALTTTASQSGAPDNLVGFGLIDAQAAVQQAMRVVVWVDFGYGGTESGTFSQPFNSLAEALAAAPSGSRVRIKASGGSTDETPLIDQAVSLEAFGGSVIIGL